MNASMIATGGIDGRAASAAVGGVRLALAWLGICAASCGMALVTALWAGV
ncbi:hypothetical protein [Cupriavidus pauculus]|nr:hypothetical protein [Cupriavidus pauculus]